MDAARARYPLVQLPTSLHRLNRLSQHTGLDLWIKRDDLTGLALGGNKGRKLEYLIADALTEDADTVVTCGSSQSNFIRQLGAACAITGLRCAAAVMDHPAEPGYETQVPAEAEQGNWLLDDLLGVDLRLMKNGTWDQLADGANDLAKELENEGRRVYRIPVGGSSVLGAYAFFQAAQELNWADQFDALVTASSSGSTQVGLAYAFYGAPPRVIGMACDPEPELKDDLTKLAYELEQIMEMNRPIDGRYLELNFNHVGAGYGIPDQSTWEAIETMAQLEGIFLDPVYSGKAFAGLLSMAKARELRKRVLFWHTGGIPALFAYKNDYYRTWAQKPK